MVQLRGTDGTAKSMQDLFAGKKVAVVGIVGSYTPTCQQSHFPAYLQNVEALKKAGAERVFCVTVNDPFVTKAFQKEVDPENKIEFFADSDASFATLIGTQVDLSGVGLGMRSGRYSLVVNDGVIEHQNEEEDPSKVTKTDAATLIAQIPINAHEAKLEKAEKLMRAGEGALALRAIGDCIVRGYPMTSRAYRVIVQSAADGGYTAALEDFV